MAMFWGITRLRGRQGFRGLWTNNFHRAEGKERRPKYPATFHSVKLWERNLGTRSLTCGRTKDQGGIPGRVNANRLPSGAVGLAGEKVWGPWMQSVV